jgi:hypothetical protein
VTVVEKIIALCDEQLVLWAEGKTYRPEVKTRLAKISADLERIQVSCPHAWKKAAAILNGEVHE